MSENIFDWKGNEVKPGMIIYFVRTKPFDMGRMGMIIPAGISESGKCEEMWEPEEEYQNRINEDIWELGTPYEVSERNGRLYMTHHYKDNPDIDSITMPITDPFGGGSTIAIKGISDTKE